MPDMKAPSREEIQAYKLVDNYDGYDEMSKENAVIYKQLRSFRSEWIKDRIQNDDFFHNQQYSKDEEADIIARGQSPLPINVTYAVVKQIIALVTSQQPTWNVFPTDDDNKELAYIGRRLLDATWYNSRGDRVLSQIVKDTAIAGVGYGLSLPEYVDDDFFVRYSHIPYWQVYISPNATQFDYSDAENIITSKLMSITQTANLFDTSKDEVDKWGQDISIYMLGEDYYPKYSKPTIEILVNTEQERQQVTRKLRVIQRLTIENKKIYIVEGNTDAMQGYKLPKRIYFEKTEDIKRLEAKGLVKCTEKTRKVVARYLSAGSHCEVEYYPISSYNIVPYIDEFRSSPYPLATVDFIYSVQRAINKFVLLAILNATLSNNMKIMFPEGSIDEAKWAEWYSIPGAQLPYKWEKDMPVPQQINPMPLPSNFFDFPDKLIQIVEYITGIFGIMQGNPEGAPRTSSGLANLQSVGGQKVKLLTRNIADALAYQGDITLQMYQNYAPYNQKVTFIQDGELQKEEYNTVGYKSGNIYINKDISSTRFRTHVKIEPNYGGERQAKANVLANLAMQTKSQALIPYVLKLADIPEADEVIKKLDIVSQQQSSMEQMSQQIERLNQINNQLQNEVIQKSQDVEMTQFTAKLDGLLTKFEKDFGIKFEQEVAKMRENMGGSKKPEKSA